MRNALNTILITVFAVMICILYPGCGPQTTSTSDPDPGNTENGNMKVSLVWDDGAVSAARSVSSVPSTVSTVRLKVSSTQKSVNTTQDFATSSGSGQMDALPAATDYSVTAQGLGSTGDLLYEGTATGVAVSAKNTTSLQITMKAVGVGSISVDWSTETTTSTTTTTSSTPNTTPTTATTSTTNTTSSTSTTTTVTTTTTTTVSSVTARKVPDTGQTTSFSTTFGEDADYSINPLSYTFHDDSTITDHVTGLIWQRQDDGTTRTWADAGAYCDNLTLAGFTDWRLPDVKELLGIVDYERYLPAIDTFQFPGTQAYSYYWSSTSWSDAYTNAWRVGFLYGLAYDYDKSNKYYVRCVRGATVGLSLTNNGNGTVTDNVTGLIWQRTDDGTTKTWEQAISYCESLSLGGQSDWRLPNVKELQSIVDYNSKSIYTSPGTDAGGSPLAINTSAFPNTIPSYYWSSTTFRANSLNAHSVYFLDGDVDGYFYDVKTSSHYVRCVRGGQ